MTVGPREVVQHLALATNAHDIDAIVECFATDYVNETPAHPGRGFTGREQVRVNWTQILGGVPDLEARVLDAVLSADTVWSEWEMAGTRRDGTPHRMRGVIIFVVVGSLIRSARFYLEPVVVDGDDATTFVRATVAPETARDRS
jgi:hypothetical protein